MIGSPRWSLGFSPAGLSHHEQVLWRHLSRKQNGETRLATNLPFGDGSYNSTHKHGDVVVYGIGFAASLVPCKWIDFQDMTFLPALSIRGNRQINWASWSTVYLVNWVNHPTEDWKSKWFMLKPPCPSTTKQRYYLTNMWLLPLRTWVDPRYWP